MKIFELAKELGITPKELIAFFRKHDYSVSSHMQKATDEMIDLARKEIVVSKDTKKETQTDEKSETKKIISANKVHKTYNPDDEITIYHWEYFGDIEYLKYRDLQALRRTEYITKPNILIMDADLRSQWGRELGDIYKYFDNIEYPEEYFDKTDEEFEELLHEAPTWLGEIIKTTAMAMIRAENYPSISKIILIDKILGTCIKDFL